MSLPRATPRAKHYHGGAKGKVTGNTVQPAPAWRVRNIPPESQSQNAIDLGSKILLSNLPLDVSEDEIVDLMKKTIGPVVLRDSFLICNSKGVPRGAAIVTFTRGIDASRARARYNGKVIDGKRAIKLEIILDRDVDSSRPSQQQPPTAPNGVQQQKPKTLFDRLGPLPSSPSHQPTKANGVANSRRTPSLLDRAAAAPFLSTPPSKPRSFSTPIQPRVVPPSAPAALNKKRQKKGPKRVRKSVADLDREMEEYAVGRRNFNSDGVMMI
ncbi:uncharacterized protein FOMMEDRAFT_142893 [Fomitiporia mediterranea MF3/22]|uniref:uncharacterized protein n=1 Tax=Fomitiporia mediterranea (strain MF3/22) TaxID=694068 RepID=UPI0004408148|nr:uncharacterized protein FOMMEDRAFT_142893 [Fomitiporia mediterranea MF3/22]EJC99354.1 hypothetical protein FOMMEDRAFT_142893 [Fomitiporia mediterranea MF3/22]